MPIDPDDRRTPPPPPPSRGPRDPDRVPMGSQPTGPNDPDNRDSSNYNPDRRQGSPSHPGLPANPTNAQIREYDSWWYKSGAIWSGYMFANPEAATFIKEQAWLYRQNPDQVINQFMANGFNQPAWRTDSSNGPGSRGPGGGGGASKEQQYGQAFAAVKNMASTLGLQLDDDAMRSLSKVVIDASWSNDQVMDYLAPGATNTTTAGSITAGVDEIKARAAQQLLTISDATAREWSTKIASGEMTMAAVSSMFQQQATLRYGWAADQINQGISVRDMMLPMRDRLASELEMAPEGVDVMDSKWLSMMQTTDEQGTTRIATENEMVRRARETTEWRSTRAASTETANASSMLMRIFGG